MGFEYRPGMQPPETFTSAGGQITSWQQWARPKRNYQWKEGRSAMELAKAWFPGDAPAVPPEIESLLLSHPRLEGLKLVRAVPELVTRLPEPGEGRNHDLWILGETPREQVTICIEAKADEPFGNYTVAEYRDLAMQRRQRGVSTRVPERIDALLRIVGGDVATWGAVRYQLLAAICGTILQAKIDASRLAVFLVHEFRTDLTSDNQLQQNALDFQLFLKKVGIDSGDTTLLGGPVPVACVDCLIGKAVRFH